MDKERIYKVLLVEPSALVAAGVRALLADFSEFKVLDTATTGDLSSCFDRVAGTGADLVLVNPALFPLMRRTSVRGIFPVLQEVTLVALCHTLVDEDLLREFDGVVNIYDSPVQIHQKLKQAVDQVVKNAHAEGYELSDREREILVAVARGMTNKEIADRHYISIHTVISHRKNISRKTGIKTIAGLTVYALLNNMISEADAAAGPA